jgi:ABC-type branched-subunit amino acid transport system ATPase component
LLLAVLFPGGLAEIGARWARRVRPGVPPGVPADNRVAPLGSLPGVRWPHGSRSARLEVVDVTVRFEGRVALDRVSLSVEPGCVLGLIGANGAGKSTLLDVISGFIIPTAGSVILDGQALAGHSPTARARAGVGRVLQDSTLFDDLTAGEAVRLASPSRPSAHDVISWFGLGDLVGTPCQLLPTAARRRVELACAVVRRPALLLLDEPTAGLGSAESSAFLPVLAAVREELGCSIVLVEHDVSLVRAAADRMVCLGAGVVLADGPPDEVLAAPAVQSGFIGGPGA